MAELGIPISDGMAATSPAQYRSSLGWSASGWPAAEEFANLCPCPLAKPRVYVRLRRLPLPVAVANELKECCMVEQFFRADDDRQLGLSGVAA